jgi:hypothetical protein
VGGGPGECSKRNPIRIPAMKTATPPMTTVSSENQTRVTSVGNPASSPSRSSALRPRHSFRPRLSAMTTLLRECP